MVVKKRGFFNMLIARNRLLCVNAFALLSGLGCPSSHLAGFYCVALCLKPTLPFNQLCIYIMVPETEPRTEVKYV